MRYLTHPHPSVRVCARLALGVAQSDASLLRDRAQILTCPPVSQILDAQYPEGYWMHRDLGTSPRYRATVWQLLLFAQLGAGSIASDTHASGHHLPGPIQRALNVVLQDNRCDTGALRLVKEAPSLALTAAMLWAVARLGAMDVGDWSSTWTWTTAQVDEGRVDPAAAVWLSRAGTAWDKGEWLQTYEPWRAVVWPPAVDSRLNYPEVLRPSLLAMMEMACEIDRPDLIADDALDWLRARRLPSGEWPLDQLPGRLWCDVGTVGEPNPWITLRALSVQARLDAKA